MRALLFLVCLALPANAAELLDLAVDDVLATPGEAVEVVAKLEKKAPRGTNVPRQSIELRLDGGRCRGGEVHQLLPPRHQGERLLRHAARRCPAR